MKSFTHTHTRTYRQLIICAQLVATLRVPATIFGQKTVGQKGTRCNQKKIQRTQTKHFSVIRQMQKTLL